MSLSGFLLKIVAAIKGFFNKLPAELQFAAHIAVTITQNIKNFTESPLADVITQLIPGDIDDHIKDWLNAKLPIILTELRLVEGKPEGTDEIIKSAIKVIQNLDSNIQHSFLHNLAILIAQEVANCQNSNLKLSDGIYIIEWYYQNVFKDQSVDPIIR